jgi:hypothetical protein
MTVWHLFSAICLVASTMSASGIAKSQHASAMAYTICVFIGLLTGLLIAIGILSCAKIVQRVVRDRAQSAKIAILSVLLAANAGSILLADLSGRWISLAVLQTFFHR